MKQLTPDPWTTAVDKYPVDSKIIGKVVSLTDYGAFIELEEGIEGLVHVSEISKENIKSPKEHYQISDTITAKVMNINSDERRIGLSIKRLVDDKYLEDFAKNVKPATSSFGAILGNSIQEQIEANKPQDNPAEEQEAAPEAQETPEFEFKFMLPSCLYSLNDGIIIYPARNYPDAFCTFCR